MFRTSTCLSSGGQIVSSLYCIWYRHCL